MLEVTIMKAKNVVLVLLLALFAVTTSLYATSESAAKRPYIGIRLDPTALPALLAKHLALSADQGIRIKNVNRDGPADKAGLERDDIIISFQGKDGTDTTDYKDLVNVVRESGVGNDITLKIIHLGKRKTVKLKIEPFEGEYDWKYPPEPEIVQRWRPGKVFRLESDKGNWTEVPLGDIPGKFELYMAGISDDGVPKFLKEVYVYQYFDDSDTYAITIEGNPNDEDTEIIVSVGETDYKTTVKKIGELPKKFHAVAEEALGDARKSADKKRKTGYQLDSPKSHIPALPALNTEKRFHDNEDWNSPDYPPAAPFGPVKEIFDKITKQMRQLQERLEELENQNREMREEFPDEQNKQKSIEYKKPIGRPDPNEK